MTRRVMQFVACTAFAVALMTGALSSSALSAPIYPFDLAQQAGILADPISFWGRAYPHGYAYRRNSCVRYTRVHPHRGWRAKRVWICHR